MMEVNLSAQQYSALSNLINSISKRDSATLSSEFNISQEIQEEIIESLENYYDTSTILTAPPKDRASESAGGGRSFIEAFHMNDGAIGIECILFADGEPGEAIIHIEMSTNTTNPKLTYKYIGS